MEVSSYPIEQEVYYFAVLLEPGEWVRIFPALKYLSREKKYRGKTRINLGRLRVTIGIYDRGWDSDWMTHDHPRWPHCSAHWSRLRHT